MPLKGGKSMTKRPVPGYRIFTEVAAATRVARIELRARINPLFTSRIK